MREERERGRGRVTRHKCQQSSQRSWQRIHENVLLLHSFPQHVIKPPGFWEKNIIPVKQSYYWPSCPTLPREERARPLIRPAGIFPVWSRNDLSSCSREMFIVKRGAGASLQSAFRVLKRETAAHEPLAKDRKTNKMNKEVINLNPCYPQGFAVNVKSTMQQRG